MEPQTETSYLHSSDNSTNFVKNNKNSIKSFWKLTISEFEVEPYM